MTPSRFKDIKVSSAGRLVSETPNFGTVIQSRYHNNPPLIDDNKTRIFHGVLRHGWNDFHLKTKHSFKINRYVAEVLKVNPNVGIVFSTSSVQQITEIMSAVE